ncbi:MAG: hypothetical protein ACI8S6_004086 [Myxococcota bacterium]|jgi:hypothetical protein
MWLRIVCVLLVLPSVLSGLLACSAGTLFTGMGMRTLISPAPLWGAILASAVLFVQGCAWIAAIAAPDATRKIVSPISVAAALGWLVWFAVSTAAMVSETAVAFGGTPMALVLNSSANLAPPLLAALSAATLYPLAHRQRPQTILLAIGLLMLSALSLLGRLWFHSAVFGVYWVWDPSVVAHAMYVSTTFLAGLSVLALMWGESREGFRR